MTTDTNDAERPDGLLASSLEAIVDDLIARLQSGEDPDLEAIVGDHREHAGSIRRLAPALKALVEFGGASARGSGRPAFEAGAAARTLGDFRIVREVGRGGMGIVYEAEQISLRRRVALKVLPSAAAMDPRHLQRFQLEAHAAAALHHANIVPVYAVGVESGTSYYAMQFIEGRSLGQLIAEMRRLAGLDRDDGTVPDLGGLTTRTLAASLLAGGPPPPEPSPATEPARDDPTPDPVPATTPTGVTPDPGGRDYILSAVRLGREAAEALDHAHAHGILHRDVKPDNLLVDLDGRLWVTDFGLAQIQGDHRLTVSGDVLGTLRYMSPEQALGRRIVVDGRSDLYSLGATIYELLTLRPAYDGRDRADVLRRITSEEPTPLQKLNPAAPADLATIVHKAMAKEPADRYATAKDLAEDLQRFLSHRPILAKPPSRLDRLVKWSRRHTAAIAAAGAVLVAAVVGLTLGLVLIAREQRLTTDALAVARAQRSLARAAVDDMYTRVAKTWLAEQPKLTSVQREFLEKALAFYEQFAAVPGSDPEMQLAAARASREVGEIRYAIGRLDESWNAHGRAVALCQDLVDRFPDEPQYRHELSRAMFRFGVNQERLGNVGHATRLFARALDLAKRLADENPQDREIRRHLAAVHQVAGDEPNLRRSLEIYESLLGERSEDALARDDGFHANVRAELALLTLNLATFLHNSGRYQEAEPLYLRAIEFLQLPSTEYPEPRRRKVLAVAHMNLGRMRSATDRLEDGLADLRRSESLLESLVEEFPDIIEYPSLLAVCCRLLGYALIDAGQHQEASRIGRRGVELVERLVEHHPSVPGDRREMVDLLCMIADVESCLPKESSSDPERALEIVSRAMTLGGDGVDARSQAWARYRAGDFRGCLKALEGKPTYPADGDFFGAMAHWRLGDEAKAREVFERADRRLSGHEGRSDHRITAAPSLLRQVRAEAARLLGVEGADAGRTGAAMPTAAP
ncbi:protein kinase domain-containing protein [Planctomyces sp. SH-PL62]|uniref:protein kinase domain-containing protein n=1 Tax=Planctomyces sp. SH-PL62 TaxID=1636152 RepID=UPI00078D9E82|nr:protein kinase [Planctomyces sp. SH-PL62]AMV41041.1 Serine/threonine-protein kinase PrkC [Planctomyces sp. SH-PL62]